MPWVSRIGRLAGTESRQERKPMKLLLRCLLLGAWVVSPSLWAWSNHTVGSYLALRELAAIREAPEVEVEPLEAFLAAERGGLAALLDEQEAYARAHIGNYPARPDALRFAAEGEAGDLRQAFLAALRVNLRSAWRWRSSRFPGRTSRSARTSSHRRCWCSRTSRRGPPGVSSAWSPASESRPWQCWPPPPTNRTTATTSTCSATTPARPASATASAPSHSATRASSSAPRRRSTWASTTRRR